MGRVSGSGLISEYKSLLERLLVEPLVPSVRSSTSVGSGWGRVERPFRELIGGRLTVQGDHVLLTSAVRPLNVGYALVSSVWILLGRDDLAPLNVHNANGVPFSMDGFTLSGAFGKRLRGGQVDQIESVVALLSRDRYSRRAIAFIGRGQDLSEEIRDFPCASSVQFFVREEWLHAVVYMRSQSLFGVFPYDLVNFRYLLEYLAERLQVTAGTLHFTFGSLHVYQEEESRIREFLNEDDSDFSPLPRLPGDDLSSLMESWGDPESGRASVRDWAASRGIVVKN